MQSLGQAVYRYVCKCSRENPDGVERKAIIQEMASRGYLEPLGKRVDSALGQYLGMDRIVRVRGRYVKKSLIENL